MMLSLRNSFVSSSSSCCSVINSANAAVVVVPDAPGIAGDGVFNCVSAIISGLEDGRRAREGG